MESQNWLERLLCYDEWKIPLLQAIRETELTLAAEYAKGVDIYPPKGLIFNAFNLTPLSQVKVVVAMGLSFSIPVGVPITPSLYKISSELDRDPGITGYQRPNHGCLEPLARQGVLMINAALTVEAKNPNSHAKIWQPLTDRAFKLVSDTCPHVVFMLWGKLAKSKRGLIDTSKHKVIEAVHPTERRNNFFGNECPPRFVVAGRGLEQSRLAQIAVKYNEYTLICFIVSRSLSVAVCGSFSVSKSTVMPYGMAIASVRAYRRPIDPLELSTLCEMSCFRRSLATMVFGES
ncbi:UNG-like protein [Mya arenaria]|uniref:UNG-like protein n=1 Tax=Mya arenaria TaxID=6604 RepID=A0ABY7DB51_MYAAR|nr:UNG-like protein [Mya arenaria]